SDLALALHQPHGAGVAVREDAFRVARRNVAQARGDGVERLVPRDGFELALTFGTHALHRREQAVRVVRAFGVAVDLGAQHAGRGRVIRVALHAGGAAVFHGDEQGTGVGAIVRASRTDDLG